MYQLFLKILFFLCLPYLTQSRSVFSPLPLTKYFEERESLLNRSLGLALGGQLKLSRKEAEANEMLMKLKIEELEEGLKDPAKFWAARHFFHSKPHIEESKVFKVIKRLPKGALLHAHSTALVSSDYVFWNITFRDNLYAKENLEGKIDLHFFKDPPGLPWVPIHEMRLKNTTFDLRLQNQLTIIRKEVSFMHADSNVIWKVFQNTFNLMKPLLSYRPVFRDYFYQALKELYEDNIRYLEFRSGVPKLYDLDGSRFDKEETIRICFETAKDFMRDYPEFWGVKLIIAPQRFTNNTLVEEYVKFVSEMSHKFPNFIAGFDLVGQEDIGPPLKDFIPALLEMRQTTRLFLHAGETLANGAKTDENLFDAVLLNASRIGHAYAILKHPTVLKMVRERNIALEICPISNQVLGLVTDMRNHPANHLIANGYPVVITSDDPSLWGAKGLSYDWYVTFMAMASKHADLRLLKQLAFNSIWFSSMEEELKQEVLKKWSKEWGEFLKEVVKGV